MKKNMKMLTGARWRSSHQHSVDSILGAGVRSVTSYGTQFLNKDHWTARQFIDKMCRWSREYPGQMPGEWNIRSWVDQSNTDSVYGKGIQIANTPDQLPADTALALVGGAYHESWHTLYSRRTNLNTAEMMRVVELWELVPNWSPLLGSLLTWSNVIEDIRIERIGCKEFPGTTEKMEALQDLILKMEREGREKAAPDPSSELLSTVMCAFRDLGLGYQSEDQLAALKSYAKRCPEAWALVNEGALRPLLDRAINLTKKDDLQCLWLAMEIVAFIRNTAKEEQQQPQKPQSGNGSANENRPQDKKDEKGEQGESGDEKGDEKKKNGKGNNEGSDKKVFKVGDRARLSSGPHKGREVEVTFAGSLDESGVQKLEFALVED